MPAVAKLPYLPTYLPTTHHRVIKRDFHPDNLRNQTFKIAQFLNLVFTQDELIALENQTREQTAERRDAVSFADAEHRGVDVGGSRFESLVGIGDGASGVVVEMRLDVAADDFAESLNLFEDFAWGRAAYGVGDPHAVRAKLIDERVERQDLGEIRTEGVFPREADLNVVGFGVFDDLLGFGGNVGHVFSVGMFHEIGRSANTHVTASMLSVMKTWLRRKRKTHIPSTPV